MEQAQLRNKRVQVEWRDARLFTGTYPEEECKRHEMCLFNSLGYLISENPTTTMFASEITDDGDYRNITLVPTGSIISIKELIFAV